MNWSGAAEFFAMGGYAFYVWGSFSVFALAIAAETILVMRRRNRLLLQLQRDHQPSGNI
jgi:heme exporter protein D